MVVYMVGGICIAVGAFILVMATFMNSPTRKPVIDEIDRKKE